MGFLSGITGALGGLAMGGPLGAVAGGLAGFLGGNGDQTQTSTMNLPEMTPQQREMMDQAYQTIQANMQAMTPEERESYIQSQAGTYFEPMAQEINNSFSTNIAKQNAFQARGGMRGSSEAKAQDEGLVRQTAGLMGQARASARQAGEQSFYMQDQNRMANLQSGMGIRSGIQNNRAMLSGRTNTMSNPGSQYGAGLGMMGYGAMAEDSWANSGGPGRLWGGIKGIFGGGGGAPAAMMAGAPASTFSQPPGQRRNMFAPTNQNTRQMY